MEKESKLFVGDVFTEFEFDIFSDNDKIDSSVKLEYIKEMLSLAKSDKQAVLLYVVFDLAAIVFLIDKLNEKVTQGGYIYLVWFCIGISCLIISSVFFFTYWRKVHKCHINMVSCIPNLNIERTRDLWMTLWQKNKRYFKLGLLFLSLGAFLLSTLILTTNLIHKQPAIIINSAK